MPLDLRPAKLADIAAWFGITPVSPAVLEAHKAAEIAKHPAHPLYNIVRCTPYPIRDAWPLFALLTAIGGFVLASASLLAGLLLPALLSFVVLCGSIASLFWAAWHPFYRVFGPAAWGELQLRPDTLWDTGAPQPILDIAARILDSDHAADMHLVIGVLTQDSIRLDPYLAIERGEDRIIIGIWDGPEIIQQATLDPQ